MLSGNKGIVFSLDAAIAVSVVIIVLINSSYYFSTSSKESLSQLQLVKIGNDVVTALDNSGALNNYSLYNLYTESSSLYINNSELGIYRYLPRNYEMSINIQNLRVDPLSSFTVNHSQCTFDCIFNISGIYVSILSPFIDRPGNYTIRLRMNVYNYTKKFNLNIDGKTLIMENLNATSSGGLSGTFLFYDYYYFNDTVNLSIGYHNMTFYTPEDPAGLTLDGYTILGENAHSKSTAGTSPVDRFIGSGERFFTIKNTTSWVNEPALVRYSIWLR